MPVFTNLTFKKCIEGFFSDKNCYSAVLKPFKSLEFVLVSCCLLLWVIRKCVVLVVCQEVHQEHEYFCIIWGLLKQLL